MLSFSCRLQSSVCCYQRRKEWSHSATDSKQVVKKKQIRSELLSVLQIASTGGVVKNRQKMCRQDKYCRHTYCKEFYFGAKDFQTKQALRGLHLCQVWNSEQTQICAFWNIIHFVLIWKASSFRRFNKHPLIKLSVGRKKLECFSVGICKVHGKCEV